MKNFLLNLTACFSFLSVSPVVAEVQRGAKVLLDYGYYKGIYHQNGQSGSGNEIRFVRLYLINKFDEHWETKQHCCRNP